jgi:RNA polymerase sigma-70 factor (ECF subfamily)
MEETAIPVHRMNEHIVDERTLDACRRGDRDAFRLLFECYKDRVYSIALGFCDGDEAAAKDITQDTFVKLMMRVSQFQNRSEFSTWLYRLVVNACLDRRRARRRIQLFAVPPRDTPDPSRSAEDRFGQRESERALRAAIASLKPKLRVAILLKYFEELSYDEMATVLGCSKGTVASRLNRGHQALARRLAHLRGAFDLGE